MQKEQRTNPILHFTSVLNYFHEKVVFFVMSWCTSGVGLQVLPFIDNRHLGSNFLASSDFLVSNSLCNGVGMAFCCGFHCIWKCEARMNVLLCWTC